MSENTQPEEMVAWATIRQRLLSEGVVRSLVLRLIEEAKLSPQEISEAMNKKVSSRTVYRWARGESAPVNAYIFKTLEDLVAERCA
jgi:hypothetical protein